MATAYKIFIITIIINSKYLSLHTHRTVSGWFVEAAATLTECDEQTGYIYIYGIRVYAA